MAPDHRRRAARGPALGLAALALLAPALLPACGSEPGRTRSDIRAAERAERAAGADQANAAGPEADRPGGARPGPRVSHAVADPRIRVWNARLGEIVERYRDLALRHAGGAARRDAIRVSVHVVDLESGVEVAARAADAARTPASNMKLVTTAAALVLLGPGTEFLTPVDATGPIVDGTLAGDLVVRASGDPLVREDGDGRVEERLDEIVRGLQRHGIRRVTGDLVLDQGTFSEPAPAPGWPDASQHWQEHCALSGGFTVNGSVLRAEVTPGRSGERARIAVHPSPHGLRTNYDVRTRSGAPLDVRVGATVSAVTVKGELPPGRPLFAADFAHPDPVGLFGAVLADRLERAGIRVEGSLRRARGAPPGQRVAELRSSVDATLGPINADSRNSVSDQLFLALGLTVVGEGTPAAGEEATRHALERLGVPTVGFVQRDGSGLSRDNRVTARQLTALLAGVLHGDPRRARTFRASLAVAGDSGTLEGRMRGGAAEGRVFAKTGWIRGASALSGVCRTLAGDELAFSILVDYPPSLGGLNTRCFKPMQDELLTRLVEESP
jgi:PBP4 family serine-type D-alanyl-D-alanine carboxypeptidase